MKVRRIVFGEPKPGFAQFAGILAALDESVSYCNRIGPLQHDRVTDVPFTLPALGFDFVHPTPLLFVRGDPLPNDPYGIFALHHMPLYVAGMLGSDNVDPVHLEAAQLCAAIYNFTDLAGWDARQLTAGVDWAVKIKDSRVYVVFRGSVTFIDWIRDIVSFDPARILQHDDFGPMWDGFVIGMADAWPRIVTVLESIPADELVITGHSLGAARAGVASAYALAHFGRVKPTQDFATNSISEISSIESGIRPQNVAES